MKRIYEKYKHKMIKMPDGVVGIVSGFTSNHLLLLVEDTSIKYCFTLDELGEEDGLFIEESYLEDCDYCLFVYADESNVISYLKDRKTNA